MKKEYSDRLNDINKKVSSKHTFVSKELSNKAHHGKKTFTSNKTIFLALMKLLREPKSSLQKKMSISMRSELMFGN